jgi:hypothetical protein
MSEFEVPDNFSLPSTMLLILSHHRPSSSLFFHDKNLFTPWESYLSRKWSIYIRLSCNEMHDLGVCHFSFCVIGSDIVPCYEVRSIFPFIESWICFISFFSWQYVFKLLNFFYNIFFYFSINLTSVYKCGKTTSHYKMSVFSFPFFVTYYFPYHSKYFLIIIYFFKS